MIDKVKWLVTVACTLALCGCVVYEPVPVGSPPLTTQQRFDRSWNAALGAMSDQGLAITDQNRAAGVIRGDRGGIAVTATLETLPDGAIKVQFGSAGGGDADNLARSVHEAYQRRMGR